MTEALANVGPVATAVYVSENFQHYVSGVFTDTTCPSGSLNHAIVLVGYGNQNGQDYYILRNSWGSNWGINGYMLFRRNNKNQCGIASYVSYPVVKPTNNPVPVSTTPPVSTTVTAPIPVTTTQSQTIKCPSGSGWYPSPGCDSAYYCQQTITYYKCPSGYIFDRKTNKCGKKNTVKCQS